MSNAVNIGQILGLMINGWACGELKLDSSFSPSTCSLLISFPSLPRPLRVRHRTTTVLHIPLLTPLPNRYRKTIGASLVLITLFLFIPFFSTSLGMLLAGGESHFLFFTSLDSSVTFPSFTEMLCGLPWGVFQTLTTSYAAEIAPQALRPFLTTYVNLCWVMGQFVSVRTKISLLLSP